LIRVLSVELNSRERRVRSGEMKSYTFLNNLVLKQK
jgi:hypothetical protein